VVAGGYARSCTAITGMTAAEIIAARADAGKPHMGLATWKKAPTGKVLKSDVAVAKNYLAEDEIKALERIVSMYLDCAEDQAARRRPCTWSIGSRSSTDS
jgi:hypothetical protein